MSLVKFKRKPWGNLITSDFFDTDDFFENRLWKKKMEMAYQLIVETNYNMAEVSLQLGYKNQSQFSKDFKKYFGIFPKKFSMQKKLPRQKVNESQM